MTAPVVAYYACDLVTGVILADIPLDAGEDVQNVLRREDTLSASLATADDACPDEWAEVMTRGKAMVVQTLDDAPVQAWTITDDTLGGSVAQFTLTTLEHCLTRDCLEADVDLTDDEATVIATICSNLPVRYGFTLNVTPTGKTQDASYAESEDRTLFDIISERVKSNLGAEWRVRIAWHDDDHRAFDKILDIGPTIGIDQPDAIFDLTADGRGNIESYTRKTSYGPGTGATLVKGYGEGSGASRPAAPPQLAADLVNTGGWPVWEDRVTYADLPDDVDEDAALLARTQAALADRRLGTVVWTITGTDTAPRPGHDFNPGDTVHIDIAPQGKRDPYGGKAALRVLGYVLSRASGQVQLILWEDSNG